jgi:hypothetical protein
MSKSVTRVVDHESRRPREETLECHPGFEAGEWRAQAEVDAPPEADVLTG